jgi:hypothetical protein
MTERLSALFCIGCGRIDVLEPCVGACDERLVDLVLAKDMTRRVRKLGRPCSTSQCCESCYSSWSRRCQSPVHQYQRIEPKLIERCKNKHDQFSTRSSRLKRWKRSTG